MRRRSFTGPLLLLMIGAFFLWRNMHPEAPVFDLVAQYWPFILILWGVLRLIEVLVFRYRGSTFTGGEIVLVVFLCIFGSGLWAGHEHGLHYDFGGMIVGESYDYPISVDAPAAGMHRITFDNPRGNIKVTGADTDRISVTGRKEVHAWNRGDADQTHNATPVEIVPQGDRLLVRTNQDHAQDSGRISDDIEVTVPRGMAIETRGRTGDIEVNDVGGDVEVSTGRADVRLARIGGNARLDVGHSDVIRAIDVKGKLDLEGRGSNVDVENVAGQVTINGAYSGALEFKNLAKPLQFEGAFNTELHAQAIPGQLSMDRSEVTGNGVTGPVRLVTRSRDVKLEGFTQSLELETEHGDVELTPAYPVPSIQARSGYGRVDLILPPKASFDLQATAERGEAVNDFGPPIEKEVSGRTATLKGRVGDGPSIRITANRGSVSVRKEGTQPSDAADEPDAKPSKAPLPPKPPAEVKM
jgi:hypothetical protein